jgi:hypothetical protein
MLLLAIALDPQDVGLAVSARHERCDPSQDDSVCRHGAPTSTARGPQLVPRFGVQPLGADVN